MKPEKIDNLDEQKFVYAHCMCPVPSNYAIKIPKIEGKSTYQFKCEDCGLTGVVITGEAINEN